MKDKYIRIGLPNKNGKSKIYRSDAVIGEEIGVSCYNCCKINNKYRIILPNPITTASIHSLRSLINSVIQDEYEVEKPNKIYLVSGNSVGYGSDYEPLLSNVKVIKDITEDFI